MFESWLKRLRNAREEERDKALRKEEQSEEDFPINEKKAVSLEIVKNEIIKVNVPRLNLHHTNSGSYQNFVKCYQACLEDIFGEKVSGTQENEEQIMEVITLVTHKLYGKMIMDSSYDEWDIEEMETLREERLIIGFQENLFAAIYSVCETYHLPFWKVLEKNLEYEIVEIDDSDSSFEVTHPVIRLSMQALLAIPSYIEDEEKYENAVLTVEGELKDHFDFFMENFKLGDIAALKEFMDENGYLLIENFEEILLDYLESSNDVKDYLVENEGLQEFVSSFPAYMPEICAYTLNNLISVARYNQYPANLSLDKETYQVLCDTFEETLETMADFWKYQGVPMNLSKDGCKDIISLVMDDMDGHMLNFAISILENSLEVSKEELRVFVASKTKDFLDRFHHAVSVEEKAKVWRTLALLLPNDVVFEVVAYENPSLIQ